ncbi:HNH endonuclease [Pseudoalteromonas rubra]|uniref:HNH endonuclease n=1 Tax=Pseudoalteromonas rubra TaxID=43658 RepID=A0A5S3X3C8_9GAMM|nr:HNH endonuclease [Pseudoalteromonas rubra]TMP38217.1 HNH endonuclease [Pseudoalteromonas rubra]
MVSIHRVKPSYSDVSKKKNYRDYKDSLKSDFSGCCGYCGSPDFVFGGKAGFQIDHFAPQDKFKHLENEYSNLIYSCPICNRGKSNKWPTDDPNIHTKDDEGFIHPCSLEYDDNLMRNRDGTIDANSDVGTYMIHVLKLYLFRHQVIWIREELRELIGQVKLRIDESSELGQKYNALTAAFYEYDEILRANIDKR